MEQAGVLFGEFAVGIGKELDYAKFFLIKLQVQHHCGKCTDPKCSTNVFRDRIGMFSGMNNNTIFCILMNKGL